MLSFSQVLLGGIIQGSVFSIVALGFSLVFRVTGVINLAQGAFCVFGAMLMYYGQVAYGLPAPVAMLAAVAGTTAFSTLVGAVTFIPALAKLPNSSVLMLTSGLLTAYTGVVILIWGSIPYSLPPYSGEAPLVIAGLRVPSQGLWLLGGSALIVVGFWFLLQKTRIGRALRACAENPSAARLMGINHRYMMLLSIALASMIGALGGILVAPLMSLQYDSGTFFTVSGFVAVAIGGMGSFAGAIFGGILLGIVDKFSVFYVSSVFSVAITQLLLLMVLIFRPSGLFASGPARREDVRDEARVNRVSISIPRRKAIILGAAALVFAVLFPLLPVSTGTFEAVTIALIIYIAVIGLDLLLGFTGQVSLGHAGFMAIGAYGTAILSTTYQWSALPSIAVSMLLSNVCAFILASATARLRGAYLALATLAFGLLVDSFTVGLVDLTGGPSGLNGIPGLTVAGVSFEDPVRMFYLLVAIAAAAVILLGNGLALGFGRSLKSVRADQMAAAALGVNVYRTKILAMCIAASLASLSGSLLAFHFRFLSPDMVGTTRSFEMIAMLVLGGEGTLVGGLVGSLLLTLLPTFVAGLDAYKTLIEGVLLVCVFLLLPAGLFGAFLQRLGLNKSTWSLRRPRAHG